MRILINLKQDQKALHQNLPKIIQLIVILLLYNHGLRPEVVVVPLNNPRTGETLKNALITPNHNIQLNNLADTVHYSSLIFRDTTSNSVYTRNQEARTPE